METDFDIGALFASLGVIELAILILTAFFASVVSGISGYGGGMTLGLLVSPFIPVKLLVPLMSVFVLPLILNLVGNCLHKPQSSQQTSIKEVKSLQPLN